LAIVRTCGSRHPFLILGPGVLFLTWLSAGFAPVWRLFYVAIIVLLQVQLVTGIITLARANYRLEAPLKLLTKLIGLVPTAILALNRVYFIPTGPAANLHALAQINYWMNVSFKIVLVVFVVNLLVESWQYFRQFVPTQRLAF
jgi:hypothetical protein